MCLCVRERERETETETEKGLIYIYQVKVTKTCLKGSIDATQKRPLTLISSYLFSMVLLAQSCKEVSTEEIINITLRILNGLACLLV